MKQKPQTKPNKDILDQFIGWSRALNKPVDECLREAFVLYKSIDSENSNVVKNLLQNGMERRKNFQFKLDLLEWTQFKHYALRENSHERDFALSVAMACFVEKYTQKIREAL